MRGTLETVVLAALLAACLVGCGRDGQNTPVMQMDSSVPGEQQSLLNNDFQVLQTAALAPPPPDQLQIMGIPDLQPTSLQRWLERRVRIVVGESFDWQRQGMETRIAGSVLPEVLSDTRLGDSQVETVMQNLGAMLYLQGRETNGLFLLRTDEGQFRVNSPRVGIIQIGQGLFDGTNSIPDSDPASQANSFLRLAVVFHEARHSDGNGDHAAFPHAICQSGDYAGDSACEENLNGPYAVQAFLLQEFYDACTDCTDTEAQGFLVLLADYQGRLLPDAVMRDDRPEALP